MKPNYCKLAFRTFVTLQIFILLLIFEISNLLAYQRPHSISLSGTWEFLATDPVVDIVSSRSGSFDPPQYHPDYQEIIPAEMQKNPLKYIDPQSNWKKIKVPSAWELVAGIEYNSAGWYRKDFAIPVDWQEAEKHIWLDFDAVATVAGVWVNQVWVGGHSGDYARWSLEITHALKSGNNQILVYVDELPGHITQGFLSVVAPHHGGIWQDVRLYATGPVTIQPDGINIRTDSETGQVDIRLEYFGQWDSTKIQPLVRIKSLKSGSRIFKTDKYQMEDHTILFQAKLNDFRKWSPEVPNMYEAIVQFISREDEQIIDQVSHRFAFRSIKIAGSNIFLNDQKLNIRSVLNWGNYPRIVAPAPPPEIVIEEFKYYKSLGFNAETVCLMIMPDYFYAIADSMGMLIWEEYPTWHNVFTPEELPTYQRLFPAFFKRDRNHPSVILRSISVEAGVKDQEVMKELVNLARNMTDTSVQDNSSWFWLSNLAISDWYGEDNYWNNNRWAKHMLIDLPEQLDSLPEKPYIIGESMAGSVWPDVDKLEQVSPDEPLPNGLVGTDEPLNGQTRPYWFPSCYDSCLKINNILRAYYNPRLLAGKDIVTDYLLPQSKKYALHFRRFQMHLMYADPRYAGWTVFLGRNVTNCHSGLYDDLNQPRWQPEDWSWLKDGMVSPVTVNQIRERDQVQSIIDLAPELSAWEDSWGWRITKSAKLFYLKDGYSDLQDILADWPESESIRENQLSQLADDALLVTSVITYPMIDFLQKGGKVLLLTSRWPGALKSGPNMYWADAIFIPPPGPLTEIERERLPDLQMFDLTQEKCEAIPVGRLKIADQVDPIIRLFEIHGISEVRTHDQLFATKVGKGLLIASSLDHSAKAGQWLLGKMLNWAEKWEGSNPDDYPYRSLAPEKLKSLAVAKTNKIVMLNADWHFKTDPDQQGESLGWQQSDFDDSGWPLIQAAKMWESQGYSYDGMAWYRKTMLVPSDWKGKKVMLIAEGVDDAYQLWINGQKVALHGSFTEHAETVFMTQTDTDLSDFLKYGKENLLVLQVVDVFGGGGINRPIYLRIE